MQRGVVIPLIFGLAGVAMLVALGVWQVQRLAWKEGVLADISARIEAAPEILPAAPDPVADRYRPVEITGRIGSEAIRVLVSQKQVGAGYRLISVLESDGRRVMLDRGFLRVDDLVPDPPRDRVTVSGNLHWPEDRLGSTPENDVAGNIWFARDLVQMAGVLGAEPVLVIAREMAPPEPGVTPLPVDTTGIPNDHLSYALTWFSLAGIWAVMSAVFILRHARGGRGMTGDERG